jgi:hypothetical protein
MSARRTAARKAADAKTAEEAPVRCFCGGADYEYSFVRFPMRHVSRCKRCGFEHRCVLKIEPTRPPPTPSPTDDDPPISFPPFWY